MLQHHPHPHHHYYDHVTPLLKDLHWLRVPERTTFKKIFAFIRRCLRTGFCSPDLADFSNLYSSSDDKLFKKILTRPDHILRSTHTFATTY